MSKENTKAIGILGIKNRTENWQTGNISALSTIAPRSSSLKSF